MGCFGERQVKDIQGPVQVVKLDNYRRKKKSEGISTMKEDEKEKKHIY